MSVWGDPERKLLLEVIATRPAEAFKVIRAAQTDRERKSGQVIPNVLLDFEHEPPNWALPDKVIAVMVANKLNQKYTGRNLEKLIANIKKIRQLLAKKFPVKGKD